MSTTIPPRADCVVMGGGPAGSAFAGIVRKYAPHLDVVVLEKATFPRWHIGESTIPVANGVLDDLGVTERMRAAGFVPKMGATFVWGRDREPWNADFLSTQRLGGSAEPSHVIDVTGQSFARVQPGATEPQRPYTAFNMLRSEFDQILLDNARQLGAGVHEGHRIRAVEAVEGGMAHDVRWVADDGREGTIRADFVLDATGAAHIMSRGQRQGDPQMANFAAFGYLRGAQWKVTYSGRREASTVFIASIESGWIWYFPVREDLMSVGVVTNADHFKEALETVDPETFFWNGLRSCPEVAALVQEARLVDDILPGGKRVGCCREWSSRAEAVVGDGWAAAGDAAMFVDPILSTGVTLALQTGHRAAYTYLSAQDASPQMARELWGAYVRYMEAEHSAYRTLARYFYGNNRSSSSWWWQAQQLVNADGHLDLSDHEAFVMAAAGFFPSARAFGTNGEAVCSMLDHLGQPGGDVYGLLRDDGVPAPEDLRAHRYAPRASFRLELRAEPGLEMGRTGKLVAFYDLHSDDEHMRHRLSARPARIPKVLAPIVARMQKAGEVRDLLEQADQVLLDAVPDVRRRGDLVLQLVAAAASKGLIDLQPCSPARESA